MSQRKNRWQAERWLQTAEEDLQAVRLLAAEDLFAAACFPCFHSRFHKW